MRKVAVWLDAHPLLCAALLGALVAAVTYDAARNTLAELGLDGSLKARSEALGG
jgi:hypothetical protein